MLRRWRAAALLWPLLATPAPAATLDQAGATLDLPDGWARKDQAGGGLLSQPH